MGVGLDTDAFEREYLQRPRIRPHFTIAVSGQIVQQLGDPPRIIRLPGGELHLGDIRRDVTGFWQRDQVLVTYEWMGGEPPQDVPQDVPQIIQAAWEHEALASQLRRESHLRILRQETAALRNLVDAHNGLDWEVHREIVGRHFNFAIIDDPLEERERGIDLARLVQQHMDEIAAAAAANYTTNEAPAGEPLTLDSLLRTMEAYRFPGPGKPKTDPARKARAILLRFLTAQQRETFTGSGVFACRGCETNAEYLVQSVRQVNIVDFTKKRRLCYVIPEVPLDDQLLAQKLLIEGDEQHLLGVARVWPF